MPDTIPCNPPFERIPVCACDPGIGPTPRNAEIFGLRAEVSRLTAERDRLLEEFQALADAYVSMGLCTGDEWSGDQHIDRAQAAIARTLEQSWNKI